MPTQAQNIAYQTQKAIKEKYGSYKKAKKKTGIQSTSRLEKWASKNLIAQKRTKSFKEALTKFGESKEKRAVSKEKEFRALQKKSRKELERANSFGLTVPEYKAKMLRNEVFSNVARGERRKETRLLDKARISREETFKEQTQGLSNPQILSSLKTPVPSLTASPVRTVIPSTISADKDFSYSPPQTNAFVNFFKKGASKGNPLAMLSLEIGSGTKKLFSGPVGSNIPRIVLGKEQTGTRIYTEQRLKEDAPAKVEEAVVLGGGALFSGVTFASQTGTRQKILPLVTDIAFLGASTGLKGERLVESLTKHVLDKPYSYSGANFEWKQLADSRAAKIGLAGVKAPAYGLMGSLPGKGARGVGRVLPKAQIRNINLGRAYNPNVRTTSYTQGNRLIKELTIKSKNKGVKSRFTVKSSYSLTESGGSVLRDAKITGESLSLGRGGLSPQGRLIPVFKTTKNFNVLGGKHKKFKGVIGQLGEKQNVFYGGKPSRITPVISGGKSSLRMFDSNKKPFKFLAIRDSAPISSGGGVFLQTQKPLGKYLLSQDLTLKQIKGIDFRTSYNKFLRRQNFDNPSLSQYAAQNIKEGSIKTKIDLGNSFLFEREASKGGFRLGMKDKLFSGEKVGYFKSGLKDFLGVELPQGGLSKSFAKTTAKNTLDYRSGFKTGTALDLSQKQSFSLDTDAASTSKSLFSEKQGSLLSTRPATSTGLKIESFSRSRVGSKVSPKETSKFRSSISLVPHTILKSKLKNPPIVPTKTFIKIPPPKIPPPLPPSTPSRPKKPVKPRKPRVPKLSFGQDSSSKKDFFRGFGVSVKKKGRFVTLGTGLTRQEALFKGSRLVGTSASASFKIFSSGFTSKKGGRGLTNKADFYSKGGGLFVEKRGRRIKSSGELQEITFKGLRSKKNKGGFFS